jgi:hypothetical protein
LLARLRGIDGVQGVVEIGADPGLTLPRVLSGYPRGLAAGLVSCAQLATVPALGRCPTGAAFAAFPAVHAEGRNLAGYTWPAVDRPARPPDRLRLYSIEVATNGSVPTIERARTMLENAYPAVAGTPSTFAETTATWQSAFHAYAQLADVVILVSLPIAGCTLAAGIAAGLVGRQRPFSLLRLAGAPLAASLGVIAATMPLLRRITGPQVARNE